MSKKQHLDQWHPNRKYKFRAWDNQHGKMLYDDIVVLSHSKVKTTLVGTVLRNKEGELSYLSPGYGQLTAMQYTGLKDKNGNEIYEGDIIKDNFGHWEKSIVEATPYWYHEFVEYGLDNAELEVIGNIHDNPELLK